MTFITFGQVWVPKLCRTLVDRDLLPQLPSSPSGRGRGGPRTL